MPDLDEVYSDRLFQLAAQIPRSERLEHKDATVSVRSRLCGSAITVDLALKDGRVTAFGQTVRACLLGQASAAVMGREIVGSTAGELHEVAAVMRRMLKENGPPPQGRWADLALLEPVRGYPLRHASVLLVFDAVEKALAEIEASRGAARATPQVAADSAGTGNG